MRCPTPARQRTARVTQWSAMLKSTCIVNCTAYVVAESTRSLCHPLLVTVRVPTVSRSHLKLVRERGTGVFIHLKFEIMALSLNICFLFTSFASPVYYSKCAELPELYHQPTNHPLGARTSAYELQCHSLDQKRNCRSLHNTGCNVHND